VLQYRRSWAMHGLTDTAIRKAAQCYRFPDGTQIHAAQLERVWKNLVCSPGAAARCNEANIEVLERLRDVLAALYEEVIHCNRYSSTGVRTI
jgi:hypothetical protein